MKQEIEAKVKVRSLKPIAARLRRLGAIFLHTVREQDVYFDNSNGTLIKKDCGLRLRKRTLSASAVDPRIFLTFKGPRGKSVFKSRRELQVQVYDFKLMKNILLSLGYRKYLTVYKIRQIWQMGRCEVCLDKVRYLGTFVEVEGPSEKTIASILDKLKIDKTRHISSGYAKMTAQKLKLRRK